jgi:23S rRNA pseudouridine1911/1915/1917 synthase
MTGRGPHDETPDPSEPSVSFIVAGGDDGARLDVVAARIPVVGSRNRAASLIDGGRVLVDGRSRPKSFKVAEGQNLTVIFEQETPDAMAAEELAVPIVFEDESLLVIDKPAGLVVHPAKGHPSGTLVNALLGHGLEGGEAFRPGIVHRLDKDTTGLMIVAKSSEAHRRLVRMMRAREIERHYLALVHGYFTADSGTIEAPIGRDPLRRKTMAVGGAGAREARTHFEVIERLGDYSLVDARLDTGRTHQIRVHFLAIGRPLAGDPVYARKDPLRVGRQFLHSHRLVFAHPLTGESLDFESPLPADLQSVLGHLRERSGAHVATDREHQAE